MKFTIIFVDILIIRISFKTKLEMSHFTNEFAFFCILKYARIFFLVLQIKHNILSFLK